MWQGERQKTNNSGVSEEPRCHQVSSCSIIKRLIAQSKIVKQYCMVVLFDMTLAVWRQLYVGVKRFGFQNRDALRVHYRQYKLASKYNNNNKKKREIYFCRFYIQHVLFFSPLPLSYNIH